MITKLTIDRIFSSAQDKSGRPFTEKFGPNAGQLKKLVSIYSSQLPKGFKSASKFCSQGDPVLEWKEGQEVMVDLKENGEYLNFTQPSEGQVMLLDHETRIEVLEGLVMRLTEKKKAEKEQF